MTKLHRQLFIRFLKELKVYSAFRLNYEKVGNYSIPLGEYLLRITKKDVISNAFNFDNTYEGCQYWVLMNILWVECLKHNSIIKFLFLRHWKL